MFSGAIIIIIIIIIKLILILLSDILLWINDLWIDTRVYYKI